MKNAKLVSPDEAYLQSYISACREFKELGLTVHSFNDPDEFHVWGPELLRKYSDNRDGINLKDGYVSCSTFWLVEDGEFIGEGSVRHRLTPELERFGGHIGYAIRASKWSQGYGTLQLTLLLREAAKLGIEHALVTCDEENTASARVMEKNGGEYQDTLENVIDGKPRRTKRYWINTAPVSRNVLREGARFYDLQDKDILAEDLPFYLEYASKTGGNALELGCGTGRVSLELARAGYKVTGLDLSSDMLTIFREKLAAAPSRVRESITIVQGNMARFSLNQKFDLIIAPFRAFQVLTRDADIFGCLDCVREHLSENGLFIVNVFRPSRILDGSWVYPDKIDWEKTDPSTGARIVKKHRGDAIDPKSQTIDVTFTYEAEWPNGATNVYSDELRMKYYYYEQLNALLKEKGFTVLEEFGWYDKGPIQTGRELIFVCGRA